MIHVISACNEEYNCFKDISKPTIVNYCRKYNYNIKFDTIPVDYSRPYSWYKIDVLKQAILDSNQVKYLLWIDSDAVILNTNFNLLDLIKSNKYLYISKDMHNINCGSMLIKKNQYMYDFLDEVWNKKEFLNHCWWEQAAIIDLIENNYNNINEHIEYVPQKYFNAYDYRFYSGHANHDGHVCKESLIFHAPSLPKLTRLELMKKYVNEYHI